MKYTNLHSISREFFRVLKRASPSRAITFSCMIHFQVQAACLLDTSSRIMSTTPIHAYACLGIVHLKGRFCEGRATSERPSQAGYHMYMTYRIAVATKIHGSAIRETRHYINISRSSQCDLLRQVGKVRTMSEHRRKAEGWSPCSRGPEPARSLCAPTW